MSDSIPKIFISYSWTRSDEVVELAERLMTDGVLVVLDKWDLKEGQDKYHFMEQCVSDIGITKVLLYCDKTYCDKANKRTGGVGDETMIISSEVYGKVSQEKFVPVVGERDEDGEAYLPSFVKSRIYVDLSDDDNYEDEYEKLLRNIHSKPLFRKPKLGSMPEWLNEEVMTLAPIRAGLKQLKSNVTSNTRLSIFTKKITNDFIDALVEVNTIKKEERGESILAKIDESKLLRDLYVEYIELLIQKEVNYTDMITSFFEDVYNATQVADEGQSYTNESFEFFSYFIWEAFVTTISILIHYEKFGEIFDILNHSYFLKTGHYKDADLAPKNYPVFREYLRTIETVCKPVCDEPRLYTLTGRIFIRREMKPLITTETLSKTDIILYQLSEFYDLKCDGTNIWFPTSYIYFKEGRSMWVRLKSRKYCEKILPLFGVSTVDEMKERIIENDSQRIGYNGSFDTAPQIKGVISPEDIASIN